MSTAKDIKSAIWQWEDKNLINYSGYVLTSNGKRESVADNMAARGYDAMRISPQITTKNGLKYRAVYGASIEPDYKQGQVGGKWHPKVTWYKQGYIKAGKSTGTTVFTRHGGIYLKDELDAKLMLKKNAKRG